MAFARFTTISVRTACKSALEKHPENSPIASRVQRLAALAEAAHGLSGEMFLTAEDFDDIRIGRAENR